MLLPKDITLFEDQGFLIIPGMFEPEVIAAMVNDAASLMERMDLIDPKNLRCRFMEHVQQGTYLEAFDPVIDLSPVARQLTEDIRLNEALADLLGEPCHLLKDKLLYKPPGGKGYDLHQDYISWPEFPKSCTIALIALDPSGPEEGGLEVWPGGHQQGYLGPENGEYHHLSEEELAGCTSSFVSLAPGDVMFFSCMLPHRSGINRGKQQRRHLYLSYNASSDGGEQREAHYRQFHEWFAPYFGAGAYFK